MMIESTPPIFQAIIKTLLLILPSYVANASPLLAVKIVKRQTPIDRGKYFIDKRRVLGNGKTIEGSIAGITMGILCSVGLHFLQLQSLEGGIVMSIGAILGDLLGSFIKRRIGIPRGKPLPIIDQLSFLLVAEAMYWLFLGPIPLYILVTSIILTLILHPLTNAIAYLIGLKQVPW